MARILNTDEEVQFASDEECIDRRNQLIFAGIITPSDNQSCVSKKDGTVVISTEKSSDCERNSLIKKSIINPNLCSLYPESNRPISVKEEGEYKSRSIKTEQEYLRRKSAYFRIMQEIIFSRRDLNLVLGKKEANDPDWFF